MSLLACAFDLSPLGRILEIIACDANFYDAANITFAQFIPDRARISGGPQLEQSTVNFANAFTARYPATQTNAQFVNLLFDTANLTPFAAERQAEIDAMNNAGRTRAQVLRNVINLTAFRNREFNPSFVLMQYCRTFAVWSARSSPLRSISCA